MEIEAVQVHEVGGARADHGPEPLREGAAVIFVVGVDSPAQDAAHVVPELAQSRMFVGNRRRFGDEGRDAPQRLPRRIERTAIRLVVDAIEGYEINVVRLLQLLQDVERAGGDSTVGWVRETLGEEEQAWSSGHPSGFPRFGRGAGAARAGRWRRARPSPTQG